MSRLPIRAQVTLAFAAALTLVLLAVGAFLYLRLDDELSQTIDTGLRSRTAEISAQVRRSGPALAGSPTAPLVEDAESFAQVLSLEGRVLDATARLRAPLLDRAQLRRARGSATFLRRDEAGPEREPARLLAVPARMERGRVIVVAGTSLDEKQETLAALLTLEAIGLTAALLFASGAGYLVSGVALRPVEAMRRRADEISGETGRRLPVPPVDDEIGRLGLTLNAMLDRIDGALANERRFVADASHELRTPLTILKSEVEVALSRGRTAHELREALASAGEEADRLSRLAEDLLVLARADDGELQLTRAAVAAHGLLTTVATRHAAQVEAAGRQINVTAPAGLSAIADRERLEQVIGNLVDNAVVHGGGEIELSGWVEGDHLVLSVRDHGAGFPDEFLGRALDRFTRPDAGRSGGGAGLGLAIATAIVRAHGGSVSVINAGPGARVEVRLSPLTESSS